MHHELTTTQSRLRLVKHYLPSVWGMVILVPSLLVPPSYRDSVAFHFALTAAWLYWVFIIYSIETTFKRMAPEVSVLPKNSWLISSLIGGHATNYVLVASSFLMSIFQQSPLSVLLIGGTPIYLLLTFCWYFSIFGGIRKFINDRLPESDRISTMPENAIAIGIGGPSIFCYVMQILGQAQTWVSYSFIPVGILISATVVLWLQNKMARALACESAIVFNAESANWSLMPGSSDGLEMFLPPPNLPPANFPDFAQI